MADADDDRATAVRTPHFAPSDPPDVAFRLTVASGPDVGLGFTLDDASAPRVLLGQSPACEFRLTDREVSRRHAALELHGNRIRIVDVGSTNGTSVNGVPIIEAFLGGGENVALGATLIHVESIAARAASLPAITHFGGVVGMSREMRRLYPILTRLAASNVPIIIEGQTGTGKEALAEALHEAGPRASQPFVVFDCTAVPDTLMEAELFGHERGAFTGAVTQRKGVFEQAHGGTLFIDEIGDLALSLQPKLLRAIERTEIRRIGGTATIRTDVRIVSATRRDLDKAVHDGTFRDDLFHRLAVTRVELPPLRQRKGDVAVLARHFCKQLGGDERALSDLYARWEQAPWPGNVRELRNAVARQLALGDLADIEASDGGHEDEDPIAKVLAADLPLVKARAQVVTAFERLYVERVLEKHGGVVSDAARASGIARRHFQRIKARLR